MPTGITVLIEDGWAELQERVVALAAAAQRIVYVPNEGNAGDALIAAATWQFFDDCRLAPVVITRSRLRRGDTAIYGGGGNLVSEYKGCAAFLRRCLKVGVRAALVLPQTIRGHEDLLRELDSRFVLVCRDFVSIDCVRDSSTRAQILMAPDMALRLDVECLFVQCRRAGVRSASLRNLFARGRLFSYALWRWRLSRLAAPVGQLHYDVIRTDAEATSSAVGEPRRDIPNLYLSNFAARGESDMVARDMLAFFESAEDVVTNRLHVGIAAALMGVRVSYLDNSYGKIKAVFDASMASLPNVIFLESRLARIHEVDVPGSGVGP